MTQNLAQPGDYAGSPRPCHHSLVAVTEKLQEIGGLGTQVGHSEKVAVPVWKKRDFAVPWWSQGLPGGPSHACCAGSGVKGSP